MLGSEHAEKEQKEGEDAQVREGTSADAVDRNESEGLGKQSEIRSGTAQSQLEMANMSEEVSNKDMAQKFDLPLTKQNLIFLQRENQALRERTKEVRLILNNKIDEL